MASAPTYRSGRAYLFLTELGGLLALMVGTVILIATLLDYLSPYYFSLAVMLCLGGLASLGVAQIAGATLDTAIATRRMADHICGEPRGSGTSSVSMHSGPAIRSEPALRARPKE